MEKKLYPAMRYHRTLPPVIVKDAEEEAALGPEWAKTPAAFYEPVAEPAAVKPEPAAPVVAKKEKKAKG